MQLKSQLLSFLEGGEFLRLLREQTGFALATSCLLGAATQGRGQRRRVAVSDPVRVAATRKTSGSSSSSSLVKPNV